MKVNVRMVESEEVEKQGADSLLSGACGVLVPGGFGGRGIEGKILAVKYARERNVPFFGICLGMQCAVMEFGRNVCGMPDANSTEFNAKTPYPVIDLMEDQRAVTQKGGTMLLGSYRCLVGGDTKARQAYGTGDISERHRHRYEFNNAFRDAMAGKGLMFSGLSPDGKLVEIVELKDHPWFVGCQFHPEFQSTPLMAHPLFRAFVAATVHRRSGTGG